MAGVATIDLNADLGEGFGAWRMADDDALLDVVTSANIACGFHGGDPATALAACRAAARRGVAIGAHVSYPDLVGFGRRFVDVAPEALFADVLYQVGALDGLARAAGSRVKYVKPHGALYHAMTTHPAQAVAVAEAVAAWQGERLAVLTSPDSLLSGEAARRGMQVVAEGFADRGYTADASLVARGRPGALLGPDAAARQAVELVCSARVHTADGSVADVRIGSICVHGDSPDALATASAVAGALGDAGVRLTAFCP